MSRNLSDFIHHGDYLPSYHNLVVFLFMSTDYMPTGNTCTCTTAIINNPVRLILMLMEFERKQNDYNIFDVPQFLWLQFRSSSPTQCIGFPIFSASSGISIVQTCDGCSSAVRNCRVFKEIDFFPYTGRSHRCVVDNEYQEIECWPARITLYIVYCQVP